MPTYVVTDPATGRKVKLTGDTPPTDQDLDEIFASLPAPKQEQNSKQDYAKSAAEVPITGLNGEQIPATPAAPVIEQPAPYQPTGIDAAISSTPVIGGAYEYAKTLTPEPVKNFLSNALAGGADVAQTGGAILSGVGSDILGRASALAGGGYPANPEKQAEIYDRVTANNQYIPSREGARNLLSGISETLAPLSQLPPMMGGVVPQMATTAAGRALIPGATVDMIESVTKKTDSPDVKSMGSAELDAAIRRREIAAQMPVDPQLTKGQATRDFDQLRFEGEAMKGELGGPLRERAEQQHQAIRQSFDEFIDQTGSTAVDAMDTGLSVQKALTARSKRDKAEIKAAYDEANRSEEALFPIDPSRKISLEDGEYSLIDYLNSKPSGLRTTGIIDDAKNYAVRLGVAKKAEDGTLIPAQTTLKNMETLRREISQSTGYEPTDIRESTILKKIIDSQTEGVAGPIYKRARDLRAKYANQYENRAVISDLISNKKGSKDRKVAIEDVFDRIAFRSSNEDARHLRKVLQNEGEAGQQAWRDIQGQALKYLRAEASKSNVRDSKGNEMISSAGLNKAINRLDEDGKLELIYGKAGAQKLRDLNDLARDLFTAPAGAINHSNTASVLLAGLDMAVSGTAGLPLPLASGVRLAVKNVKDRRLKKRIQDALKAPEENK